MMKSPNIVFSQNVPLIKWFMTTVKELSQELVDYKKGLF